MAGKSIVVMGVCGSGKSTIGDKVSKLMGYKFIDGDDLHPKANIIKMAGGEALNDDDRAPWLERIRDAAFSLESKNETGIIVCSALKKSYRDKIRNGNQHVHFLYLEASIELIMQRMRARKGHFMQESMVNGQFATLERPENEPNVAVVDIDGTREQVIERAISALTQLNIIKEVA
ncbi:gluconokinase [Psychromonas sp. MME2]|uniref:gluconokinase n=1 Tax=unclassified Psychromonas TaxID=2614957 RepID=UPI00339D0965